MKEGKGTGQKEPAEEGKEEVRELARERKMEGKNSFEIKKC